MRRYGWGFGHTALLLFGMAACVMFGVALATQGTERIHGSLAARASSAASGGQADVARRPGIGPANEAARLAAEAKLGAAAAGGAAQPAGQKPSRPAGVSEAAGLNRLGNKLGELLQIAAYHGIQLLVKLFEVLVH